MNKEIKSIADINSIAGEGGGPRSVGLATRCLSDIVAKPVSWLWPGRIARGKVTIIAGNPGLGKSQITASIAAIVTTGTNWPAGGGTCSRSNVVFLNAEDDPADTLRPRLEAAGADLKRVHFVDGVNEKGESGERLFSLEDDIDALDLKLKEIGNVGLLAIDPISAYLGSVDSHKNADIRRLLAPLNELAARHNTAIVGISHLNKSAGTDALMRVTGSLAFVAAARAAFLVTADPQDKSRRLFLPMKNNIAPDGEGLAFTIEPASVASSGGMLATSRIEWKSEPVTISANEAMQSFEGQGESVSAVEEAALWLESTLNEGSVAAKTLFDLAKGDGIAQKTLNRAAKPLGVHKYKCGMKGGWVWSLSPKVANEDEDAQ